MYEYDLQLLEEWSQFQYHLETKSVFAGNTEHIHFKDHLTNANQETLLTLTEASHYAVTKPGIPPVWIW